MINGVEALPLIAAYAHSAAVEERMVFMRVYLDLMVECRRRRASVPDDWAQALQACLSRADPQERDLYVASIGANRAPGPAHREASAFAFATRDDIDAVLRVGALDDVIALARDGRARLRPEHLDRLVARARRLAATGERRLAEALLARTPVRLHVAPLFLEANAEQRAAILVAAQRADLGRSVPATPARRDERIEGRLEFAAVTGDGAEFAAVLAEALGVEPELAWRIAEDRGGEPLTLTLMAFGVPRDLVVRIVTALDMREGQAFPRIHAFSRLADRVAVAAARRVVAAMTGAASDGAAAPLEPAAPREAANPSPFARRETPARRASFSPETRVRPALNSRKP